MVKTDWDGVIDESKEKSFRRPTNRDEDEAEIVSRVRQAQSKGEYVLRGAPLPAVRVSELRNKKVIDEIMFKNDTLRKKHDLRNADPKTINNIFLRAHIRQLKERTSSNSSNA